MATSVLQAEFTSDRDCRHEKSQFFVEKLSRPRFIGRRAGCSSGQKEARNLPGKRAGSRSMASCPQTPRHLDSTAQERVERSRVHHGMESGLTLEHGCFLPTAESQLSPPAWTTLYCSHTHLSTPRIRPGCPHGRSHLYLLAVQPKSSWSSLCNSSFSLPLPAAHPVQT